MCLFAIELFSAHQLSPIPESSHSLLGSDPAHPLQHGEQRGLQPRHQHHLQLTGLQERWVQTTETAGCMIYKIDNQGCVQICKHRWTFRNVCKCEHWNYGKVSIKNEMFSQKHLAWTAQRKRLCTHLRFGLLWLICSCNGSGDQESVKLSLFLLRLTKCFLAHKIVKTNNGMFTHSLKNIFCVLKGHLFFTESFRNDSFVSFSLKPSGNQVHLFQLHFLSCTC